MSEALRFEPKFRLDYQTPGFRIHTTELTFLLDDTRTQVTNEMDIECLSDGDTLRLDGEGLILKSVHLNGRPLEHTRYRQGNKSLRVFDVPKRFRLKIVTEINPTENTALEGLYKSAGTFCTQCEAEGFRRITYYLDRPDVLSVFTTRIQAPKEKYPFLLANGNCIRQLTDGLMHTVTWHDPFPKPAYLFALVAGDFDVLRDSFTTKTGRAVKLELFVEHGNRERAVFAMESLKRAMVWDEERFQLEYDLDIYMIVAVDFFNMGAMENKGLNIFNAKYVLADTKTATDQDFINVESVIGHEYFHNWTGNRVTCQDWFQLSLKEGLTVFRDQEFSADMGMRAVKRIQDVRIMRNHQFAEDSSPMAHPIRPDKVLEMNNFYTVTVYNKGAEVIRMLHTLLGEEGFQRGFQTYIQSHDGQAVTCEDFVRSMEIANHRDLTQFRHWYAYAGTPEVKIEFEFDVAQGTGAFVLSQRTPDTTDQRDKPEMHIPLRLECVSPSGEPIDIYQDGKPLRLIELTKRQERVCFVAPAGRFIPAFLADFSAPVRLDFQQSEDDLLAILRGARDTFLRWDACQRLFLEALKRAITCDQQVQLSARFIAILTAALSDPNQDPALLALILQVPNEEELAQEYATIPVTAISRAVKSLRIALSTSLRDTLLNLYRMSDWSLDVLTGEAIGRRMLTNTLAQLLAYHHEDQEILSLLDQQFHKARTMTLKLGALMALTHANHPSSEDYLAIFSASWAHEKLVMDKWFAVQASASEFGTPGKMRALTQSPAFDWTNPNRIYALLLTFTHNQGQLHAEDGSGYALIEEAICRLNVTNPQVASRLLSPLLIWRKLPERQKRRLKETLERIQKLDNLAPDLHEKLTQALGANSEFH